MIFKRLASLLKQDKPPTEQTANITDDTTREFEAVARALEDTLGKESVEYIIESWHHGESSIAIESLIDNLIELEPTLSNGLQERIAKFAEQEDHFNEQKWQRYTDEMTPEQIEKFDLKKPRTTLLAEFREVYPGQKATQ